MSILHVHEYHHHRGEFCALKASPELLKRVLGDKYVLTTRRLQAVPSICDKEDIALYKDTLAIVSKVELLDHLVDIGLKLVTVLNDSGRKAITYVFVSA